MKETYTLYCTCYISLPLGSTFFNHDAVSENNKKLYKIGLIYQFSCSETYIYTYVPDLCTCTYKTIIVN